MEQDISLEFSNDQIDIARLPKVEHLDMVGLDKRYLTAEIIALSTLFGELILVASIVFVVADDRPPLVSWLVWAGIFIAIACSFTLLVLGFRKKKYALRENDIVYQSGLLWRNYTVLPFDRIQHVEVQQGPIDRLFELGKLKIYTAGGSSSDMSIAGLPFTRANRMRHFILKRTDFDEEE